MRERLQLSSSLSPNLQQVTFLLRIIGWITFWIQLVIGVASVVILLLFAVLSPNPDIQEGLLKGNGFGVFFAICGLVNLGVGIYIAFRYTRVSKKLRFSDPERRPSKAYTLKILKLGLIINLVGMAFTIIGAEAIVGSILFAAARAPQGGSILEARRFVQPLDIFTVQANINTIVAHFIGIIASIVLLNRVNRKSEV